MSLRIRGRVKWFNDQKGYGFIKPDAGQAESKEVFVHFKDIQGSGFKSLGENQAVEFEIKESPKGLRAVAVIRV